MLESIGAIDYIVPAGVLEPFIILVAYMHFMARTVHTGPGERSIVCLTNVRTERFHFKSAP